MWCFKDKFIPVPDVNFLILFAEVTTVTLTETPTAMTTMTPTMTRTRTPIKMATATKGRRMGQIRRTTLEQRSSARPTTLKTKKPIL